MRGNVPVLVALYLTLLPAPRLYGVDTDRILDQDGLRAAVAKADVLITDTEFDVSMVPVKRCCVLRVDGIDRFATENGYDCIDASEVADWFKRVLKVDVTRRARSAVSSAAAPAVAGGQRAPVSSVDGRHKAMYDSLVTELSKSDSYKNLDPGDAKTYDILLQVMRDRLRKADGVAGDLTATNSKLVRAEAEVERLENERNIVSEDVDAVLSGLTQVVYECRRVLETVSAMSGDADLVEYSSTAVKAKAGLGLASKLESVIEAQELRAVSSVVREFLSCVSGIAQELGAIGAGAIKAAAGAQSASHNASMAKANAERTVQQAKSLLEQEQKTTLNLKNQLAEINSKYQQQIQRVAEVENQLLLSGGANIPALQEQVRTLRAELQLKQEQMLRMEEINNALDDEAGVNDGALPPEVATGMIRQLRTQIASLKLERDRATNELMKAKQAAVREAERAETLTNSARSLSQVALRGAQVSALPVFNYAAKALIIPVFGNGSVGVTSAALSLAKMLGVNSKTVLVDYDLVCTDLEGRFGERINPLASLDGEKDTTGRNSAMGIFVHKGKDFFAQHYTELAIRIDSNKAGILDYLPGFYAKPDLFSLTQADYTTLLNYLGARYEYVVVDAGKIGCSEIGDQILRNLCLCAFRSLIVTDASVGKARAMRLKLNDVFGTELRRIMERGVWMTNRAIRREDLSKFTAPAMSVALPVIPEMVGVHESFHLTASAQREFNKVARALAGV